jgi:hypothetical protein
MLAPPPASLLDEKSVLSHASLNTPTVYPKDSSRSSLYLSGYHLSHVWACSIYLFHQHIISFGRSHFTPVSAILVAAIRKESNLPRIAAKRCQSRVLQRSDQKGSIQREGEEDELQGRRRSATPSRLHRGRNRAVESTP